MKIPAHYIFLALLSASNSYAQEGNAIQLQIDELKSRVRTLERENLQLMREGRSLDSLQYSRVRHQVFDAASNLPALELDYRYTNEKIALTGLFTKLMEANNPTSDILGFRFTDVIFQAAERHFRSNLRSDHDRRRFSQLISKILENPVVTSLANTNPVTSVVSAIVSSIVGFTTTSASLEKEGSKVRDVAVEQNDAFNTKMITAFREEVQDYIDFYDQLIRASEQYLSGLENLDRKYAYLMQKISGFEAEFACKSGCEGQIDLIRLTELFPEPGLPGTDYRALLADENAAAIAELAAKYPQLRQDVDSLKKEYEGLIREFLEEYIRILESALKFPEKAISRERIGGLIDEIRVFLSVRENS
jgi:hypothetical protein